AISVARRSLSLTGYSIPIDGAEVVAQELIAHGSLARPQMGVSIQELTPTLAGQLGLPVTRGVLITQVQPGSPAALAELAEGDVIVGLDGSTVSATDDLRRLMVNHQVGDTVTLRIATAGRSTRTVTLSLV